MAYAGVAQLVERQISNLNVASSNLVARSNPCKHEDVFRVQDVVVPV